MEIFWPRPQKLLTYTVSTDIVYIINFWCRVPQHFLLSAAARSLSLAQVARLSDAEAHAKFCELRWHDNDGNPYCPHCGGRDIYRYEARRIFKCKACRRQFSATSGTLFHSRKLSHRDYLLAIAIFVNGAKGHAALQLSRDLNVQYKTAFVLSHKLREALGSQVHDPEAPELAGEVHVDGLYTGGHVRPANRKEDRTDRRFADAQSGKRQVVVVAREVLGRTLPFIVPRESAAVPLIRQNVASGTHRPCRRVGRLGRSARILSNDAGEPFSGVQERGRRLH
jgi:transposase-like protein